MKHRAPPAEAALFFVRIHGDEEQTRRWAAAARQDGFRPRAGNDQDGTPVLAVILQQPSEAGRLADLMRQVGAGGVLERAP
jgi:hypothetical protein